MGIVWHSAPKSEIWHLKCFLFRLSRLACVLGRLWLFGLFRVSKSGTPKPFLTDGALGLLGIPAFLEYPSARAFIVTCTGDEAPS